MHAFIVAAFLAIIPNPDALVHQLGSRDFREREEATKALRGLGMKAYPAVRAGLKNPLPKVVRRKTEKDRDQNHIRNCIASRESVTCE